MEQSRKIQIVAILALMIATMSLLVGFSSLNAQLEFLAQMSVNEYEKQNGEIIIDEATLYSK